MNDIKDFIIGGISATCSRTITAPLELLKIQKQNMFMKQDLIKTYYNDGIFGLWKGNGLNCIRIFPQNAISYSVYSLHLTPYSFINGCLGGLTSTLCTYPIDNLRTRKSFERSKSVIHMARSMSLRELYQGVGVTGFGYMSFSGLNFMFYELYRPYTNSFLCGGLSGMSALCFTYPTDLIRRRLQLQGYHKNVPKYSSIIDCIQKIKINDGYSGFYRGFIINLIKIIPTMAIQFTLIENFQNFWKTFS